MGESTKFVCTLLTIVGAVCAVSAWVEDRPGTIVWVLRIGASLIALLALGLNLKLRCRTDLAPDYLRAGADAYFNRDGFCFAFSVEPVDGIAYMELYFQTQRDQPSLGQVAIRPALGFFLKRPDL